MSTNSVILWISIFVVIAVTATELPLVEESGQGIYLVSRILIAFGFLALFLIRRQKERIGYGIAWAALFYAYCYVGEWYRPLYIMALLQVQILHALYYRHSKYSFLVTHMVGTGLFSILLAMNWSKNVVRLSHSSVQDQLTIAFCSLAASFLVYVAIERARVRSETVTKRMALIGSYATSLIHDLKNLSAAPLLYSEMLVSSSEKSSSQLNSQAENTASKIAMLLNEDLKKIQFLVRELYNSTKISVVTQDTVSLSELISVSEQLLGPRLKGISLQVLGDSSVKTDRRILQVMLLNLFYNAISALNRIEGRERRIRVEIQPGRIEISSNSVLGAHHLSNGGDAGVGLMLMEELSRNTNVSIRQEIRGESWVTTLSFA